MKHQADIGRCTISKHPVELELGDVPYRENARIMSPEKHNEPTRKCATCLL